MPSFLVLGGCEYLSSSWYWCIICRCASHGFHDWSADFTYQSGGSCQDCRRGGLCWPSRWHWGASPFSVDGHRFLGGTASNPCFEGDPSRCIAACRGCRGAGVGPTICRCWEEDSHWVWGTMQGRLSVVVKEASAIPHGMGSWGTLGGTSIAWGSGIKFPACFIGFHDSSSSGTSTRVTRCYDYGASADSEWSSALS